MLDNKAYYEAINEERARIARDLHDGPIQIMVHVGHKLDFAQNMLEKHAIESAQNELRQICTLLESCLYALREDVSSLMKTQVAPLDIDQSLQAIFAEFQESEPAIHATCVLDSLSEVPAQITQPLYHFVQEALRNVRNHARATEVVLCVELHTTSLLAEVRDNGIGLEGTQLQQNGRQHLGMRIMHERVQEVGGYVEFVSNEGTGTCARAIFPPTVA